MSMYLGIIFLPPAPKMYNNFIKNMIWMTKLELQGMYFICVDFIHELTSVNLLQT